MSASMTPTLVIHILYRDTCAALSGGICPQTLPIKTPTSHIPLSRFPL